MVKRNIFMLMLLAVLLPAAAGAASAPSPSRQEVLKGYLADLQKNPNDDGLRLKIIRHAQAMKPAPAVPEEAQRFMARGAAAVKGAKGPADFKDAAKEFKKAALLAPWLSDVYYNLGVAQDKAGEYASAIRSLKLYLAASPNASDAKEVKTLIYEIEYRQEKAAKESSPEALAEKKRRQEQELIGKLDGARWTWKFDERTSNTNELVRSETQRLELIGGELVFSFMVTYDAYPRSDTRIGVWQEWWRIPAAGRELSGEKCKNGYQCPERGVISEDGSTITFVYTYGGKNSEVVYRRER